MTNTTPCRAAFASTDAVRIRILSPGSAADRKTVVEFLECALIKKGCDMMAAGRFDAQHTLVDWYTAETEAMRNALAGEPTTRLLAGMVRAALEVMGIRSEMVEA